MSKFFQPLVNKIFLYRKTFLTNFRQTHYSQFGEDIILGELLNKKKGGVYVDVGCYHPKKLSNTYRLHKQGWHGVNIDMEANKVDMFKLARPDDFNVLAAVSDKKEVVNMYRYREFGLGATIDERCAKSTRSEVMDTIKVTTSTLDDILAHSPYRNQKIDVLSIDVEGNDFKVLKSLSLDVYHPDIIIIEEHLQDIESIINGEMYGYLKLNGYVLHSWVHLSLIFKKTH